ncbi:type II secretion system F family protein [Candidatus Woesearchaeota archaeon]|nr:type II secretion system F family protein [Candidatus Woesearchaeota archaeon]
MAPLFRRIAHSMPDLALKLRQADMTLTPELFIRRTFISAAMSTALLSVILAVFLARSGKAHYAAFIAVPLFAVLFLYFLRLPDVKAMVRTRAINSEIIDAGRFLIVELESGVSMYDAFRGINRNFKQIGPAFKRITVKVDTGASVEEAISEVVDFTPSPDLRRILWQLLNSLSTGSDVVRSLKDVVEQVSKEHLIAVREYGRKLNPLAMFYMVIAVIVPSLGITMLVVLASFLSIQLDLVVLLVIAGLLGLLQLMFLAVVKNSRPAVNM